MGRLSDIVLRGLQFEAEQESRALQDEARKMQMEDIVRERVQEKLRTSPGYIQAWDRVTNPETRTEELGRYAGSLGADVQAAMQARIENQRIDARNKWTVANDMAKHARDMEGLVKREEMRRKTMEQDDVRTRERDVFLEAGRDRRDNPPPTPRPEKPPSLPAYTPDDAQDIIARRMFGVNFNALSDPDKDISARVGKVTQEQAATVAAQAADDLIRLQDSGVERGRALELVLRSVVKERDKKGRLVSLTYAPVEIEQPAAKPAEPTGPSAAQELTDEQEEQLEQAVARAVADGKADTTALREGLRRILLGGK